MLMKTKYIVKGLIASLLLTFAVSGCESYNEAIINDLTVDREFSPIALTAKVRNQTTVELNWNVKAEEQPGKFIVEFSADDPEFKTIFKTVEVEPSQLPVSIQLEGETTYSIRVKAISGAGLEDSKWAITTAKTLSEQLFLPFANGDVEAKQVTLRWLPNVSATEIVINPGNISHAITPAEKLAGIATVTGLAAETTYKANLMNGLKQRGEINFTTAIDIGNGILVKATDDLMQKIADAESGAILVLEPGDYMADNQTGAVTLNKSITLKGLYSYNMPKLHVNFFMGNGAANLSLIDLDLKGDKSTGAISLVRYTDNNVTYGALLISGCNVHDYGASFVNVNLSAARIPSVTVENSIVTNILTGGSEFIDIRGSHVAQLTLKNSTFNNCASARSFVRMDAGLTGLTANILIDACTITNPNTTAAAASAVFYTRFAGNAITVKNTLWANTPAPYRRETATSNPVFSNNNYFNAPNLDGNLNAISNNRPDTSGTALDPQFANAAAGDFTLGNQILKDDQIGDPRWIK